MNDLQQLLQIYDEVELAIVFDWFGLARPPVLNAVDLKLYGENEFPEEAAGRVRLMRSDGGFSDQNSLSNAVARLLLSEIQGRLPQWGVAHGDGTVNLARAYAPRRDATIDFMPRFLFEINWADSGPGFSWPEAYHVTYVPGFDRYVVTASQDSPDMHGYTDEAIGHFAPEEGQEDGAGRVIRAWWQRQADDGQPGWAYLFNVGEINADTAQRWADEVWDPETGEPLSWAHKAAGKREN